MKTFLTIAAIGVSVTTVIIGSALMSYAIASYLNSIQEGMGAPAMFGVIAFPALALIVFDKVFMHRN